MTEAAIKTDIRRLALAVHAALRDLDPTRLRSADEAAAPSGEAAGMGERLSALAGRAAGLRDAAAAHQAGLTAGLTARLHELAEILRQRPERPDWSEVRARLHESYDRLGSELRELDVHVPAVRPSNHARSVYHMISSSAVVALALVAPPSWLLPLAVAFAATAWTIETIRRVAPGFNDAVMRVFAPVAHPHEYGLINSGTWYVTGLVILAALADPWVCAVAVAVLGWGDPVAAIVGRRWGRTRLLHGRTAEGTAAFIVAAGLATAVTLAFGHPGVPRFAWICLASGVAGAAAELVSGRIDDNLSIPLVVAATVTLIAGG